jgi:hypothetical protein
MGRAIRHIRGEMQQMSGKDLADPPRPPCSPDAAKTAISGCMEYDQEASARDRIRSDGLGTGCGYDMRQQRFKLSFETRELKLKRLRKKKAWRATGSLRQHQKKPKPRNYVS